MERVQKASVMDLLFARPVSGETLVFAFICFVDMALTVLFIEFGLAIEANPLLAPVVESSLAAFVLVKIATFLLPLGVIEALRQERPKFIRFALRVGILGYCVVYLLGSLRVNGMI